MKRHPALEPFSRDHNDGLILARALLEGRPGAAERFREAWGRELSDHFAEEERLLIPLMKEPLAERLVHEHRTIARIGLTLPESASELGHALENHIRWEERELFPEIEQHLTDSQIQWLASETTRLEERRWPDNPRREMLVRRRCESSQ